MKYEDLKIIYVKNQIDIPKNFTGKVVSKLTTCTYLNGERHSFEDQPSTIKHSCNRLYYQKNGMFHRLSGPAVIYNDEFYYMDKIYYINDKIITYEQWLNHPLVKAYNMFRETELEGIF